MNKFMWKLTSVVAVQILVGIWLAPGALAQTRIAIAEWSSPQWGSDYSYSAQENQEQPASSYVSLEPPDFWYRLFGYQSRQPSSSDLDPSGCGSVAAVVKNRQIMFHHSKTHGHMIPFRVSNLKELYEYKTAATTHAVLYSLMALFSISLLGMAVARLYHRRSARNATQKVSLKSHLAVVGVVAVFFTAIFTYNQQSQLVLAGMGHLLESNQHQYRSSELVESVVRGVEPIVQESKVKMKAIPPVYNLTLHRLKAQALSFMTFGWNQVYEIDAQILAVEALLQIHMHELGRASRLIRTIEKRCSI